MSTFSYPTTLIGPSSAGPETLEALVDTGATFTTVPAPFLERLGVRRQRRVRLRLANGQVVDLDP